MPTINRKVPLLLAIGMALAMLTITGWQGFQLWQMEAGRTLPTPETPKAGNSPADSIVPDVELSELTLFGGDESTQSTPEANTGDLPETNLRLVLRGAMAADGEFPGSALIEGPNGETKAYLVGDSLPGDALLRTVLANRVILERDGKLENLYFQETDSPQAINPASDKQTEPAKPSRQSPASMPATAASSDEQARREEIRSRLQQLRQRLQDNN